MEFSDYIDHEDLRRWIYKLGCPCRPPGKQKPFGVLAPGRPGPAFVPTKAPVLSARLKEESLCGAGTAAVHQH